jgi:DNA mismatch endonuclease, patch repair protein
MADIVDKRTRSRMMSGIKGKNTKPELTIRKGLYHRGFRYRLHLANLPGKPDMVFIGRKAVIMVNGCFWHAHNCHLFKWPSSREEFWRKKIGRNKEKDAETKQALSEKGWRILVVWECSLKGRTLLPQEKALDTIAEWLDNKHSGNKEITGEDNASNKS